MGSHVLVEVALYAAIAFAPLLVLLLARRGTWLLGRLRVLLVRLHCWPRPPVVPAGPPLEEVAASLRRLYPAAHHPCAGTRMPKQRGVLLAYDGRLVAAARALDVPTSLEDLPVDSVDREAERMRLEHALDRAGLLWQGSRSWPPDRAA